MNVSNHYVYRIYAASGDLLYVGQTVNVKKRMYGHQWWLRDHPDHRLRVEGPFTKAEADVLERRAIRTEAPRRNKQWRSFREPTIVTEAVMSETLATNYLVGPFHIHGWGSAIVRGFGIEPTAKPDKHMGDIFRLLDLEAKYLELNSEAAA